MLRTNTVTGTGSKSALDPTRIGLAELLLGLNIGPDRQTEHLRCALPLLPIVPWSWVDMDDPLPWSVLLTAFQVALVLLVALLALGWFMSEFVLLL